MCFSFYPGCMFDLGVTGALFLHLQPVKIMCYRTRAGRNRPSRKVFLFFCLLCLLSHGSRISRSSHSMSVWGIKPVLTSRSRASCLFIAPCSTRYEMAHHNSQGCEERFWPSWLSPPKALTVYACRFPCLPNVGPVHLPSSLKNTHF